MEKPASYTEQRTTTALGAPPNDFKAAVCIWLPGGIDSHNMFVPQGTNSNRVHYENARPEGVRIEQNELLPLTGTNPQWGLHPALTALRDIWNLNPSRLAIIRDVGTLTEAGTTRSNYLAPATANRYQPDGPGAHNLQQEQWQDGLIHRAVDRSTGWFGRLMSLLDGAWNTNQNDLKISLMSRGEFSRQNRMFAPGSPIVLPLGARSAAYTFGTAGQTAANLRALAGESSGSGLDLPARTNLMEATHRAAFTQGLAAPGYVNGALLPLPSAVSAALVSNTALRDVVQQLYTAKNSPELGITRACAFYPRGLGWDNHNLLRFNQDPRLETLNNDIVILTNALQLAGLWDDVVVFTESEFSRTLTSNGTLGTDHGRAGHSFAFGGAVVGGLYGDEPNYDPNGPRNVGRHRVYFLPSVATEQYFATILRWFGIPESLVPLLLPASANPRPQVGFGPGAYIPAPFVPQALTYLPY